MVKINQIWIQGIDHLRRTQPEFYSYLQLWKVLFPNCEHKLWSEKDYLPLIEEYSKDLLAIYNSAPSFACKCDIARLVILYSQEGANLYVDTDYEPFRNFEYLINDPSINLAIVAMNLCKSKIFFGNYRYSNAWIYAKGGCSYLKVMLNRIIAHPYNSSKYSAFKYTWNITGPNGLTTVVKELDLIHCDDVRILPHSMIEVAAFPNTVTATASKAEILKTHPFAVGVHRMNASWMKWAFVYKQFGRIYSFYNDWDDFIIIGFISTSFILLFLLFYLRV